MVIGNHNLTWTRPAPKGAGEALLYLDFDGVLHHENVWWHPKRGPYLKAPPQYSLFQHAPLLEELLHPYPAIRIVLSTSWARVYGCAKAAKRLPPGLRERVIGATFHSSMLKEAFADAPRGLQIWRDVQRRQPRDWIAIDDDHDDWPEACLHHFIQTNPTEGISEPAVLATLKARLEQLGCIK